MTHPVSVIVPWYGDSDHWSSLVQRAVRSAGAQTVPCDIYVEFGDSLAEARNLGAERSRSEFLVFLDADDELDPRYVEAMLGARAALRQPATLGISNGRPDNNPVVIKPRGRTLLDGNHLVIGTMMRRSDFLAVGGFRDLVAWEDWDLFIRLWLHGCDIEVVEEAVYLVHVGRGSRNDLSAQDAGRLFKEIRARYRPEAQKKGLI